MSKLHPESRSKTPHLAQDRDTPLVEALSSIGAVGSAIAFPTGDQSEQFSNIDGYFHDLKLELQAYFSGCKSQFHGGGMYEQTVRAEARYLRALYDVLFDGWNAIESAAESSGAEIPNSPGATLAFVLQSYQELMARSALEGGSVNIEQSRQLLAALDGSSKSAPSAKTRHYASGLINKGHALGEFIAFCIGSVKARSRGKPHLRRAINELNAAQLDRTRILKKSIRGLKGETWELGQRKSH